MYTTARIGQVWVNVKQGVDDEEQVQIEKLSLVDKMLKVTFKYSYIIVKVIISVWCNKRQKSTKETL